MVNEKRLIDANALIEEMKECAITRQDLYCNGYAKEFINNAPTVDAVEVVHGQWEKHGKHDWRCSVCKVGVPYSFTGHNYCPNCGAKMDGGTT